MAPRRAGALGKAFLLFATSGTLLYLSWVALQRGLDRRALDLPWLHALQDVVPSWVGVPAQSTPSPLNLDPHFHVPAEPQERHFDWTIRREVKAPDGIPRLMYTINGEFPGPTIEAVEGDTLVVRVRNEIDDDYEVSWVPVSSRLDLVHPEGHDRKFSIHWHGLSMRGMQVMDGAASFTSCPITPGNETTYTFTLHPEDVGTYWYHSHVGTSRGDGLWGMLVVHARRDERALFKELAPSSELHWDEDITVALGDHFHTMGPESLAMYVSKQLSKAEPVPESGLINGKHVFSCEMSRLTDVPCPAGDEDEVGEYTTFALESDKQYRLRLVNVGSLADVTFSVDGHTMTVIEADGTLVQPMKVHRVPLAPGQRYSVILHREPGFKTDRYWMRSDMSGECFKYMNPVLDPFTKAVVVYNRASDSGVGGWLSPLRVRSARDAISEYVFRRGARSVLRPQTTGWLPNVTDPGIPTVQCEDLQPGTLIPLVSDPAPPLDYANGDRREFVTIEVLERQKYLVPLAFLNSTTWRPYGNRGPSQQPQLHRLSHSNVSTPAEWYAEGTLNKEHELVAVTHPNKPIVFDLVIENLDDGPHPFHLHGHKFWVLHTGEMELAGFNYTSEVEASFDLAHAMKRDTIVVPMMGHVVIRWVADNPGVWALHCHMLVHLATGMAMSIVEQPELLQAQPTVPRTCQ